MSQPVVDTLRLSDALRKAGMEREQAERFARALGDQLGDHVVAQGDLHAGFLEVRGEIQSVDHRVDLARTELGGQIQVLDGKIDGVRTELGGQIQVLDGKIDRVQTELGGRIDRVQTELGGRIDRVETELTSGLAVVGGQLKALRTTLTVVGATVSLLIAAIAFVAGTDVLRTRASWYAPPPEAVPAPAAGGAVRTPIR